MAYMCVGAEARTEHRPVCTSAAVSGERTAKFRVGDRADIAHRRVCAGQNQNTEEPFWFHMKASAVQRSLQVWIAGRDSRPQAIPAGGGVSSAFPQGPLVLPRDQCHCGGGVCFCDRHLSGLGGVLPAVGTVAGIVAPRGTVFVEAVRSAALRLTLHEITLKVRGDRRSWRLQLDFRRANKLPRPASQSLTG